MSNEKKFYFAVDDVVRLRAKRVNGVIEFSEDPNSWEVDKNGFHYRNVSYKFVDSPKKALLNILLLNSRDSNDPEMCKHVISNVKYDEKENCFKWDEYLTLGTEKWPKACQWEHFESGEYTFKVVRHEVQILVSEVPEIDVNEVLN
jgi:hypothetical protein